MKKILILAFIGLGILTQTIQAFHPTDLSDIIAENKKLDDSDKSAQQAAALILYANANKAFRSCMKSLEVSFEKNERENFDKIALALPKLGLIHITQALQDGTLSLLRDSTHFLLVDSEMNAAYFQVGTEEQLEAAEAAEFDVTPLFTQENEYATAQAFATYLQEETVNAHIVAGIMRATENFADSIHKALVSSAANNEVPEDIVKKCETLGLTKEQEAQSNLWPFAGGFATACAIIGAGAAYFYFTSKND